MNALLNYSFGNYILPNTKNIIPEVGFGQRPIKRFPFLRVSFYRDNFMHLGYHNQKLLTYLTKNMWKQKKIYIIETSSHSQLATCLKSNLLKQSHSLANSFEHQSPFDSKSHNT